MAEPPLPTARGNPLRRTRTSGVWVGVIVFTVVLVLLLVFIVQNTQSVQISYFGASGNVSLPWPCCSPPWLECCWPPSPDRCGTGNCADGCGEPCPEPRH
jgi:hypothetical protein